MKLYCTYITLYLGDKLPPFYIGSTTIEKVNNGYNGSVKSKKYKEVYNKEQIENKHLFQTVIMKTFYRRRMALKAENYIQKQFNVVKSNQFYNMACAQGKFGMNNNTPESIQKGLETRIKNNSNAHSKETKQKIGLANKGRKHSQLTCKNMSMGQIGKKQPQSMKDKTKLRMSKHIHIYDSNDNLMFKCFGNFKTICEENNLPILGLRNSYYQNTKLYLNRKPRNIANIKFKGWYAKLEEKL